MQRSNFSKNNLLCEINGAQLLVSWAMHNICCAPRFSIKLHNFLQLPNFLRDLRGICWYKFLLLRQILHYSW